MKLKKFIKIIEQLEKNYGGEIEIKFVSTANRMLFEPKVVVKLKDKYDVFNKSKENVECLVVSMDGFQGVFMEELFLKDIEQEAKNQEWVLVEVITYLMELLLLLGKRIILKKDILLIKSLLFQEIFTTV